MVDWSKGTDVARVGCGALMMLSWCSGAQTVPRKYPHIVTPPPSYPCNDQLLVRGRMDPCFWLFTPNSDSNPNVAAEKDSSGPETLFHRLLSSFGEPVWIVAPVLLWHQQGFSPGEPLLTGFYVNHSCLGKSSRSACLAPTISPHSKHLSSSSSPPPKSIYEVQPYDWLITSLC